MKQILLFITLIMFFSISCNMDNKEKRLQKVVARNEQGKITKTFDGFIYRIFDTLGRQIEWYGNYKNEESNSNIHNFVFYSDTVVVAKEYLLEDDNVACKIEDLLNCFISKYYYVNGDLVRREYLTPVKNNDGKITGHKLVEADDDPNVNPFVHKLPEYLQ